MTDLAVKALYIPFEMSFRSYYSKLSAKIEESHARIFPRIIVY